MHIKCPQLDDALIEYLSHAFPDQAVDPSVTDPAQAFGRQEVIRHLKAVKAEQEDPEQDVYAPT